MPAAEMTARTREIMRALKSTAQPGSQSGGFGAVTGPSISPGPSPLVMSYGEWTSGRASGTRYSLPRDPETFLSGMFGPLAPIQTIPIDVPREGEERPEPRRWQYPVGWNMPMGMPGTEGIGKLADFQTLRTIADLYSVARACIELRKAELRGVGWDIVLTKQAAKALRGDHKGMADFAKRRAEAVRWWRRPDHDYADFSTWFDALLEEVFVTDALALYAQPSLGTRKGLLGSSLAALDLIDGTLIKPLVDIRGSRPQPPNPSYQQFSYGVPRVDLMTLLTHHETPDERELVAEYRGDQLFYLPYSQRTWTPYGMAPIERAIIPIMAGLNKQAYQLNFFQEGSIPGLFVSPGDMNMTPSQIRELQDALNALAGDQSWKHKIIVLPGGSKVDPQKPAALADQFDDVIMAQTCMAFGVMPMELGISPQVSSSQSSAAANQMAKASQDIQERKSTVPLLLWLKTAIFDRILQGVCGQADMEWQFEGLEEDEDAETVTSLLVQQVGTGMRSIDEARQELGLDPWNLPVTSDPGWSTERTGFVSFTATGAFPTAGGASQGDTQTDSQSGSVALPAADPRQAITAPKPPDDGKPSTPAHSAAHATPDATRSKPASGNGRAGKAASLGQWRARDIPAHVMAIMAEDLGKGLTADEVCASVRPLLAGSKPALRELGLIRSWLRKSHTNVTTRHGHGDQTHEVYAYLGRHYPASVLEWVKEARWDEPRKVALSKIDMARRPGGARDEQKVALIAAAIRAGVHLPPVVLVNVPGKNLYEIADGWHRTLAIKHAGGKTALAWVGKAGAKTGPWDGEMNRAKLNKAAGGGAGPKAGNPAWDHDQVLAAEFARQLARGLQASVHAGPFAHAWLQARRQGASAPQASPAVRAAVRHALASVLYALWARAWGLGWRAALTLLAAQLRRLLTGDPGVSARGLRQLLLQAEQRIGAMTQTRIGRLERLLGETPENISAAELASLIDAELGSFDAALLVTQTETTWAVSEAMVTAYLDAGITEARWQTADDDVTCLRCLANEAQGALPVGDQYASGDTSPPAHPRCRCGLLPAGN